MEDSEIKIYREWPIKRWYQMLEEVYGGRNKNKLNQDLWLHVVEELGSLARDMRKENTEGTLINIADLFAWHAAFTSRYGDLDNFLWHKFPGVCPYCVSEEYCECINKKEKSEVDNDLLNELRIENIDKKPETLYGWQQKLTKIYGRINKSYDVSTLAWHLTEEIGEVVKAYRLNNIQNLEDELADVFAWLVSVTIKCTDIIGQELRLDDIIWNRYPDKCPHCNAKPCQPSCEKTTNRN